MSGPPLRRKAIMGICYEAASDNLGIYPEKVSGGDRHYEKRSDWQEGWNACVLKQAEYLVVVERWLRSLPEDTRLIVESLLIRDAISISIDTGVNGLYVDCGDVFYWACADSEFIGLDELPELRRWITVYSMWGGTIWACLKRNMRPQWPVAEAMIADDAWPPAMDALPLRTDRGDHGWDIPAARDWLATRSNNEQIGTD